MFMKIFINTNNELFLPFDLVFVSVFSMLGNSHVIDWAPEPDVWLPWPPGLVLCECAAFFVDHCVLPVTLF